MYSLNYIIHKYLSSSSLYQRLRSPGQKLPPPSSTYWHFIIHWPRAFNRGKRKTEVKRRREKLTIVFWHLTLTAARDFPLFKEEVSFHVCIRSRAFDCRAVLASAFTERWIFSFSAARRSFFRVISLSACAAYIALLIEIYCQYVKEILCCYAEHEKDMISKQRNDILGEYLSAQRNGVGAGNAVKISEW